MAQAALDTREHILSAALKRFAEQGYAGTSVQQIVDAARVTKPTLYYYFKNKAGLYGALVDWAFEERYRLMEEAVRRGGSLDRQLTGICTVTFKFIQSHRELMRLAFATAFAARGEVPEEAQCSRRGKRNFEFIHALMKRAVSDGELSRQFNPEELAMSFVGIVNFHVMVFLIGARDSLNGRTARRLVDLFLAGARPARSRA